MKRPSSPIETQQQYPEINKAVHSLRPVIMSLDPLLRDGIRETLARLADDSKHGPDSLASQGLKPNPATRDEAQRSLLERALSYDLLRLMMVLESQHLGDSSPALAVSTDSMVSPSSPPAHAFGQDSPDVPEAGLFTSLLLFHSISSD